MRVLPWFASGVLAAALIALWVVQCSGPRPEVVGAPSVRVPEQPGQPYVVEATVRNAGPGHGEIQVTARLRDRASGRTYQETDRTQLEAGDEARVAIPIHAPQADYEPRIEIEYPPG